MSITRRLFAICIGLALLSLVVVGLEIGTTAASVDQPAPPSPTLFAGPSADEHEPASSHHRSFQQAAQAETTIGEDKRHTNIQVLKEFPNSQLIPMMNLMSASLGVRCNFCHVNNAGQWDYATDAKPEKKTAREMITMTIGLNKASFEGRYEVSCFTCHGGRNHPLTAPALPIPEPAPRPGRGGPGQGAPGAGGPAAPAAAPLPTADEVLNKYLAAIGGQPAIDKLKTRSMKGTYTPARGEAATFGVDLSAPDKFHLTVNQPQGKMERGFDGAAGWEKGLRGVSDLGGQVLADMKGLFSLFGNIRLKEQFTRMAVRKEKLDGRDVNVIAATRVDGKRERLYFDAESGLLLRRSLSLQTPIGVVPQELNFADYQVLDEIKVPFTISVLTVDQGSNATLKFTEIKNNTPMDDGSFNKPAAAAPAQTKP